VKRDDDYIRELLFGFEAESEWLFIMPGETTDASNDERRERYHIEIMMDIGLLTYFGTSTFRLTAAGHDFLDAIRDDTNWNRTKEVAAKAGGVGLGLMRDIALGFIRQKAVELGIPLS
jgi:Hypothetical protein (DUF2513)